MNTINISLPSKLKQQAHSLVKSGYYASMSDLVRDALRKVISQSQYDLMFKEAKQEEKSGKTKSLDSQGSISDFIDSL